MRPYDAEVNQDDDRRDRQPIADDGERPCITGIRFEDEAAARTAFKVGPPGKQPALTAVGTALE